MTLQMVRVGLKRSAFKPDIKEKCKNRRGSEELWKYSYEKLIKPNVEKGTLKRINSPLIFIVGVQA